MADVLMVAPLAYPVAEVRLESWGLDGWQPAEISVHTPDPPLAVYRIEAPSLYRGDLVRSSYRSEAGGEWSDWSNTLAVTVAESRPAPTPVPEPGLSGGLLIGAVALALASLRTQKPAPV